MRTGITFWLICISLVFTRLLGLHLHACAGLETGVNHTGTHYADNGFMFGDHHSEDDTDVRELELAAAVVSTISIDPADLIAPLPVQTHQLSSAEQLKTLVAPRGPPAAWSGHPPYFTPPTHGPPNSLA